MKQLEQAPVVRAPRTLVIAVTSEKLNLTGSFPRTEKGEKEAEKFLKDAKKTNDQINASARLFNETLKKEYARNMARTARVRVSNRPASEMPASVTMQFLPTNHLVIAIKTV